MICFICDTEIKQEMLLTINDNLVLGFYAIVVRNMQLAICPKCYKDWNRILELLLSRFKEQKYIDENIGKRIVEYQE